MRLRNRWVGALAALVFVACGSAVAQVKPFHVVGAGVATSGLPLPTQPARPHWAIGEATHLGLYYGEGAVQTDVNNFAVHPDGHITGEFGSGEAFVFEAANGNKLVTNYGRTDLGAAQPGTFELTPTGNPGEYVALFIAEFVVDPDASTGKFKGVTGSWIMYALSAPFILGSDDATPYAWEGQGSLTFPKKK